jgi:DmsE family decaheme c-type cytochrome
MQMNAIRNILMALALAAGLAAAPARAADSPLPDMGTSAAARAMQAEESLKKDAVCTRCHDESENKPILTLYQTRHGVRADGRAPNCQSCHGESEKHLKGNTDGKGRPPVDVAFKKGVYSQSGHKERSGQCITCHEGGNRTHWEGAQHQANGVACNDCHKVHKPQDPVLAKTSQTEVCYACHKKQRAETHRVSTHPIDAAKMVCSDCHNPHGAVGPKLLKKNTVNETCFTCHAEKRGPFLWSHASANDDCMNCHTPHGSTVAPLLKVRAPWLCQQCHGGTTPHPGNIYSGASLPGGPIANANQSTAATNPVDPLTGARISLNNPPVQAAYRGCVNCHSQVHGSNHPAGIYLLR